MQKGTSALSGLKILILMGALGLFFSCGFPGSEIHIHDRHDCSYNIIKDFKSASPAPALVLIDYQYDTWIDDLLLEGVISAVYWVTEFSVTEFSMEQTTLPKNCIVSIDLAVLAHEKKYLPAIFLKQY
jgi:hypothetical protein